MEGRKEGWMDGKAGLRIAYSNKKLNKFTKGGNCKIQKGVLIYIEKQSMGKFNKGGNSKLQLS